MILCGAKAMITYSNVGGGSQTVYDYIGSGACCTGNYGQNKDFVAIGEDIAIRL